MLTLNAWLQESDDPYKATEACLTLRSQRPEQDMIEDEVQDALLQLKEVLEISSTERLKQAKQELLLMIERMNAMVSQIHGWFC